MESITELGIRIACFMLGFIGLLAWEVSRPAHPFNLTRRQRWPANLGLAVVNRLVLLPFSGIAVAMYATQNSWGLLNVYDVPVWLASLIALLLLDLGIYWQHRLFHRVDWLWRIHRTHHADPDLDVSTGLRFHPAEAILSMFIKMGLVAALGAPPIAVMAFDLLLNLTSMFSHGNMRLPKWLDRILGTTIVTPNFHRSHHSQNPRELHSHFGFCLVWWDHLFRTSGRSNLEEIPEEIKVGIEGFSSARANRFLTLIRHPIYPIKGSGSASS